MYFAVVKNVYQLGIIRDFFDSHASLLFRVYGVLYFVFVPLSFVCFMACIKIVFITNLTELARYWLMVFVFLNFLVSFFAFVYMPVV